MTEFEFAKKYLSDFRELLSNIDLNKLKEVADALLITHKNGKRIFSMGNGGSASTASHLACDLAKGSSVYAMSLTDNVATMTAIGNDISYSMIFLEQLRHNRLGEGDAVVSISASGNSENILRAVEYANTVSAETIGLVGFDGGKLRYVAKRSIVVPSFDYGHVEGVHSILAHLIPAYMRGCK